MLDGTTYDQHDCRIQTTAQTRYYSTVLFFIKITDYVLRKILIRRHWTRRPQFPKRE